jgi:hypothetical protein
VTIEDSSAQTTQVGIFKGFETTTPKSFEGPIGNQSKNCENLDVCSFRPIKINSFPNADLAQTKITCMKFRKRSNKKIYKGTASTKLHRMRTRVT